MLTRMNQVEFAAPVPDHKVLHVTLHIPSRNPGRYLCFSIWSTNPTKSDYSVQVQSDPKNMKLHCTSVGIVHTHDFKFINGRGDDDCIFKIMKNKQKTFHKMNMAQHHFRMTQMCTYQLQKETISSLLISLGKICFLLTINYSFATCSCI